MVQLLTANQDHIAQRAGLNLKVKSISAILTGLVKWTPFGIFLTTEPNDILADPDIQVVVEVMGGQEPALSYIMEALSQGKHVVTANKDLLATHGKELLLLPRKLA